MPAGRGNWRHFYDAGDKRMVCYVEQAVVQSARFYIRAGLDSIVFFDGGRAVFGLAKELAARIAGFRPGIKGLEPVFPEAFDGDLEGGEHHSYFFRPAGIECSLVGLFFLFSIAGLGFFRTYNALVRDIVYDRKFLPGIEIGGLFADTLYFVGDFCRLFELCDLDD